MPAWMSGCWQWSEGERWGEECWTIPRAGQMLGSGRTGKGDKVHSFEFMRIALDEPNGDEPVIRMAFVAAPGGGAGWTTFAWDSSDKPGVTFSNAAHDYPQRVRYWREGERLMAEVSLADGTKSQRWSFARMGG